MKQRACPLCVCVRARVHPSVPVRVYQTKARQSFWGETQTLLNGVSGDECIAWQPFEMARPLNAGISLASIRSSVT